MARPGRSLWGYKLRETVEVMVGLPIENPPGIASHMPFDWHLAEIIEFTDQRLIRVRIPDPRGGAATTAVISRPDHIRKFGGFTVELLEKYLEAP